MCHQLYSAMKYLTQTLNSKQKEDAIHTKKGKAIAHLSKIYKLVTSNFLTLNDFREFAITLNKFVEFYSDNTDCRR